jgi:hypothetical protein
MNKFLTYNHKDYDINNDETYNCNISIEKALSNGQIKCKATTSNLNPLEFLHVKLGHAPEHVIKRILKFNMLKGSPYTFDDIKDEHLGLRYLCMKGRMKAFPIPPSVDKKRWGIFEYITVDIIPVNFKSIRGHKYMSLFVDKTTPMTFPKLMKKTSDFLRVLEEIIHENGLDKNPRSLEVRVLQGDHDPVIVDNKVKDYLNKKNIMLYTSAPYIHQENLADTYVQSINDGLRSITIHQNIIGVML